MSTAFGDLAFTPAVQKLQEEAGSREAYAAMDGSINRKDRLTMRETRFIQARDHFFQATVSETGWPYVQHRGGPAGFLKVLDERTLGYADYRGNVQYVSTGNLMHDSRISLILMDYASQRRLKLMGRVRLISQDSEPELMQKLHADNGHSVVERGVIIALEAFDWNCPRHITPRFTEAEINEMLAPLKARIDELQAQLAEQNSRRT